MKSSMRFSKKTLFSHRVSSASMSRVLRRMFSLSLFLLQEHRSVYQRQRVLGDAFRGGARLGLHVQGSIMGKQRVFLEFFESGLGVVVIHSFLRTERWHARRSRECIIVLASGAGRESVERGENAVRRFLRAKTD